MSKNILFIIDSLGAGGAEVAVLTLARTMIQRGHRVTIISADNVLEFDVDFPVNIHTLDFKKSQWQNTYRKFGKKLQKLVEELESKLGKFDLITSHLQKAHRLTAIAQIANAYYCVHNTISQSSLSGRSGLRLFLKRRKLKSLLDHKNIITVSQGVQEDLIKIVRINPKSVRTIYDPLDFEKIEKLSREPNPYHNESYIIHVGRLEKQKRHDLLLKAYAKSNIEEKLLLLGDGSLKDNIQKLATDLGIDKHVIFAGFHKNPYPIIKDATAFVATSDYEGFFIALAEALVLGVPVISTNCANGPSEILTGVLSEYLVPVGDIEAISKN
jgi:glycosyltransferase involved in cell wall biosynthesis